MWIIDHIKYEKFFKLIYSKISFDHNDDCMRFCKFYRRDRCNLFSVKTNLNHHRCEDCIKTFKSYEELVNSNEDFVL